METSEIIGLAVVIILLVGIVTPLLYHPSPPAELMNLPMPPSTVHWTVKKDLAEFRSLEARVNNGLLVLAQGGPTLYISEDKGTYNYSISDEGKLQLALSGLGAKVEAPSRLQDLKLDVENAMLSLNLSAGRAVIHMSNGIMSGELREVSSLSLETFNGMGGLEVRTEGGKITVKCGNGMFTLKVYVPKDVGIKVIGNSSNAGFSLSLNGKKVGFSYVDEGYDAYSKKVEIRYEVSNGSLSINVERG